MIGTRWSPASLIASLTRRSDSIPIAMCSADAGTFARKASTTGLRPATYSGPSTPGLPRRTPAVPPPDSVRIRSAASAFLPTAARLAAALALRAAGCLGRSVAFGVGPLPSKALRRCPPDPTSGFFLLVGRFLGSGISALLVAASAALLLCPQHGCRLRPTGRVRRRRPQSPYGYGHPRALRGRAGRARQWSRSGRRTRTTATATRGR